MAELPGPSASLVDSVPPGRPLISKLAGKRTRADIYLSTAAEREREREEEGGGKQQEREAANASRASDNVGFIGRRRRINDFARSPEPFLSIPRESVSGA